MIKEYNVNNKTIKVIDDVFSLHQRLFFYDAFRNSKYQIGWEDTGGIETLHLKNLFAQYNQVDLERLNFIPTIQANPYTSHLFEKYCISKVVVNLSFANNTYYNHTHDEDMVLLYYGNLNWSSEWAGETLFYDEQCKEVEKAFAYTPGRLIIFDGKIPHTIRSQSASAPQFRFTMGIFWKKK